MVHGKKVKGGPLDQYEEYVISLNGERVGVPGTERHGNMLASIQDAITHQRVDRPVIDYAGTEGDVVMASSAEKRLRSGTTESEEKERPPSNRARNDETPSQPNLPGEEHISPPDNRETHLINPNSRARNARNPRRNILPDSPELPPTQPSENMDTEGESIAPMGARSMSLAVSESGTGKRKRAIMPLYTTPAWKMLEERKMVRLPLKIYFSINKLDRQTPVTFKFQLNEYWNQFRNQSFVNQEFNVTNDVEEEQALVALLNTGAGTTVGAAQRLEDRTGIPRNVANRAKGISRDQAYDQYITDNGTFVQKPVNINYFEARQFPRTTPCETASTVNSTGEGKFGTATGDIQPDYRNFYERFYQNRHVHGCAWKLTVTNASKTDQSRAVVFHKTETVSQNNDSANQNWETNRPLQDVVNWPHKQMVPISGHETVITGLYRSDQAHHDIIDDDEIKEWYPTATFNPTTNAPTVPTFSPAFEENETFLFYADGQVMADPCFNAYLEIDWLVEYRDLRRVWRNPLRSTTQDILLGKITDLYATFPNPATWPSVKNFSNVELGHIARWFPMGPADVH